MTDADVVAELDHWLVGVEPTTPYAPPVLQPLLQRARDEIVALRAERDRTGQFVDKVRQLVAQARAEALEEAARVCDFASTEHATSIAWKMWANACDRCAAAIRALKDKPS